MLPQHTDHAKVMWHGAYVAWLEEARVEALAGSGLDYAAMTEFGVEMPVVSLRIDYRRALMHGDFVTLESRCLERQGVCWPWSCRFLRDGEAGAQTSCCWLLVCLSCMRNPRRVSHTDTNRAGVSL